MLSEGRRMPTELHQRAKTYPYPIPDHSYIYRDGTIERLNPGDPMPDLTNRRPVLAVGSNQSPQQLARKFPPVTKDRQSKDGQSGWGEIPVIRVGLKDFDTVYSPHLTAYGSVPATLQHAPGTTVTLFVNWLTPEQEAWMHQTEVSAANYLFGQLEGVEIIPEIGEVMTSAYVYRGERGVLLKDGEPVPLAEVPAKNRQWQAMDQKQALAFVRDHTDPTETLDSYILKTVNNPQTRKQRTRNLEEISQPFSFPGFVAVPI